MNTLDIVVIVVILLSAGLAFARGFIREILSIVSWIGAAIVAFYGYAYVAPFTERFLPKGPFANLAAAAIVFVVALIVLTIITSAISRRVSQSRLSSFDRVFGLLFGLARGVVLVCLAYIGLAWFLPPDKRPEWVTQARTLPFLESGADTLENLVPAALRERAITTARDKVGVGASDADAAMRALLAPKAADKPPANTPPSYTPGDRRDMDRIIQQQQGQK